MGSTAASPDLPKSRPGQRATGKHPQRADSLGSESATRLLYGASQDAPVPRTTSNRSASGKTRASTINDPQDIDDDADSSDVDEADFGMDNPAKHQETSAEKTRMKILLDSFNESQMARYEVFRRVKLNTINVKRLANNILSQSLPQNIAVVIAGSSKVFVSEIVERAREVQRNGGQSGPLSPDHLREAYRLYKLETGLVPHNQRPIFR